jgi:tRNA pseudouridine32 synthase/23S rRNA pseudouridine746 synthase
MPRAADAEVPASTVTVPAGAWAHVAAFLAERFPHVPLEEWQARAAAGAITVGGRPVAAGPPVRPGDRVGYRRAVAGESAVAGRVTVLHADERIVVADKPPFLPVMPAGRFASDTLVGRLRAGFGDSLVALHRLDRATAGLVLLSRDPATRGAYQALFRERRVVKVYEALAPALPGLTFPRIVRSRIVPGEPFFRMREADGPPNAETAIDVLTREGPYWRYRLEPVTGRKHQLRVQMAGLGAPILGDRWYPDLRDDAPDDPLAPLRLLARTLEFDDPVDGTRRRFESTSTLAPVAGADSPATA